MNLFKQTKQNMTTNCMASYLSNRTVFALRPLLVRNPLVYEINTACMERESYKLPSASDVEVNKFEFWWHLLGLLVFCYLRFTRSPVNIVLEHQKAKA